MKQLTPYHFFYKYAGWSYDPKIETRTQGRIRCAKELAKAEELFKQLEGDDLYFEQVEDFDDCCLGDFETIEDYRSGKYIMFTCAIMRRADYLPTKDKVYCLASLGGVSVTDWTDPYIRVVRAELALEAYEDLEEILAETTEQQITE